VLITPPESDEDIAVPRRIADMVSRCSEWDTLPEHARRICLHFGLPDHAQASVTEALREAADRQLLVSAADLLDRARARVQPGEPVRIGTIGVVTKLRPAALVRCLRSYCKNLQVHGRSARLTVIDSSPPDGAAAVRDALGALESESSTAVRCIGITDKATFARRLARTADVDPQLAEFALLGMPGQTCDVGANRNALLLAHAGETVLCTDDDMECDLREPSEPSQEVALRGEDLSPPVTLHRTVSTARESLVARDRCVLDLHERCLGRPLAAVLAEASDDQIALGALDAGLMTSLLRGSGKVAASFGGYYGDSGARYPAFFLWSHPALRDQLLAGPDAYRALVDSRQMVRLVPRLTLTSSRFSMCMNVALDGRELLPPFFPNMRGEDLFFGNLLRACFPDHHVAHVPQAVAHLPWQAREPYQALWDPSPSFQMASVLNQILDVVNGSVQLGAPGERRLRRLGRDLRELARLSSGDLRQLLRECTTLPTGRLLARCEQLLEDVKDEPAYWARDLRGYLEHLLNVLASPHCGIPTELQRGQSIEDAIASLRRYLESYGSLLEAWPELFSAAQRLGPDL